MTEAVVGSELPLAERAAAEVVDLHAFFVDWIGTSGRDRGLDPGRMTGVFADDFHIVGPSGGRFDRVAAIEWLMHGRASRGTAAEPFTMWIEDVAAAAVAPGAVLVSYVECQDGDFLDGNQGPSRRRASAILVDRPGTPNGVAWLHVHETWIDPPAPKTG